ncbi:putative peptidoglycan lipid II flippase [Treponema bryantii]|uniref:Probable lipid II flippase MurJ n=1 Tax=Treponema bryantii TaxID=163 RepID=A0A1I3ICH9_9SPIR|nr:murein biosynthesis integral membrane protein MurJ [Treponema bryantii]SFI45725.1 putative peptidoglycan lipid II flippase [Treponema bryantii]
MKEKKSKSIVKSGLLLTLMTFASRIMGLVREMTKASFLGTGLFADSFSVAFMLPNLFRKLFAENAISVAFIPTFKDYLAQEDTLENKKTTQEFLNATLTLVTFLTACVVSLGIIFAPFIIPIFCKAPAPDVADYAAKMEYYLLEFNETTVLTRIMFPYLFLISVAAFFQGVLNTCGIFAPSGFTPVMFNGLVVLTTYILAPHTSNPARAMAIGTLFGGSVQAVFQWPFVRKTGWKTGLTSLKKAFTNPGTRKVMGLLAPTIVGIAAYQLNDTVSTALAKHVGPGIASSLQYSIRLQELILGIFAVSIGTVILPDLSGFANKKDWAQFNTMLLQAIKIMTLISIPITAYSLISGRELISLLYKRNQFDDNSVAMTLGIFRFHIAGLLFIALNRIMAPAFYAQKKPKLPTIAGLINFGSNILLVFILSKPMGGNGIAFALSLASLLNTAFLFIFMKKMESIEVGRLARGTLIYALKMCVLSVIAAVPTYFVHNALTGLFEGHGSLIAYGAPVVISALLFAIIGVLELVITRDEVISVILKKVRK